MLGLVMAATWGCLMGLERIGLIEGAQLPMLLFILMATAVGVVVPVLKDRPDLGGIGQPLLIAGFLLEFVAIIGVGVLAALERGGIGWRFALLLAIPGALGLLVWLVNYGSDRFPTLPKTLHEPRADVVAAEDPRGTGAAGDVRGALADGRDRARAGSVHGGAGGDDHFAAARFDREGQARRAGLWVLRPDLFHPRGGDA